MIQKIVSISVLCIILLNIFLAYNQKSIQNQVCFKDRCFHVELAETLEKKTRGLMYRDHLNANKGMLFIFEEEDKHPFWMKNTLIPLDIIWINKDGEVVYMSKNTQPCRMDPCSIITPDKNSRYVLEINSGMIDTMELKIGDRLQFIKPS